jgi:hypothetical protein
MYTLKKIDKDKVLRQRQTSHLVPERAKQSPWEGDLGATFGFYKERILP